jgi:predicted Zn-dependent protease
MTDIRDIADRVVAMVGDRAEAEVNVSAGRSALTRFANSFIHQNVGETYHAVSLRVAADGHVARGSSNRIDEESLDSLVRGTLEAAALSPADPDWPGLAAAKEAPEVDHYDAATADATPAQRAAVVKDFVDAGEGLLAAGFCDTDAGEQAYANSVGQRLYGRATRATVDGIHQTGESAGSAHQTSLRLADLDGAAAGALAADRARSGMGAYDIKPGEYEVVLAPEATATITVFLALYGFNGKAVVEGQSFVDVGSQQFDPSIALWDDASAPGTLGVPFDLEGTPRGRVDLIKDGVTMSVVHDRRTAGRMGAESTGHSIPGSESWGPVPTALSFVAGADDPEDMIAAVDRGLYVATFNYCRILDPKSQVVTGLTRNGTFMIENGRITGAVTNLRFTQSFLEALGEGRVLGIGDDRRYADSEFGPGLVQAPSLRLAGWNFTGGAEG